MSRLASWQPSEAERDGRGESIDEETKMTGDEDKMKISVG